MGGSVSSAGAAGEGERRRLEEALQRERASVARLEAAVRREREATAKIRSNWQWGMVGGSAFVLTASLVGAFMVRRRMKGVVDAVERQWQSLHDTSMRDARKRAEAELRSTRKFAVEAMARDLLPVADCLEYAHRHALQSTSAAGAGSTAALGSTAGSAAGAASGQSGSAEVAAIVEGVVLTERGLLAALKKHGIEKQDPQGDKFDPNLHEAIRRVEGDSAAAAPGCVADVHRSGYMIHERVLRAAQVAVNVSVQEPVAAAQPEITEEQAAAADADVAAEPPNGSEGSGGRDASAATGGADVSSASRSVARGGSP